MKKVIVLGPRHKRNMTRIAFSIFESPIQHAVSVLLRCFRHKCNSIVAFAIQSPLIILAVGSAVFAASGCAKTVGPVEFLSVYRRSSPMMDARSGYRAIYEGRDSRYHYLTVRQSTLSEGGMATLLWGAYRDEKLRCPVEQLPYDFPDGFEVIAAEPADMDQPAVQAETKAQTDKYVHRYLSEHHMPAPAPPPGK